MKKTIIFILISLPLFSVAQKDSHLKEYQGHYIQATNPITYLNTTKVYSSPDTTSILAGILNFNTDIVPIKFSQFSDWITINWLNDTAYVKTTDIALFSFYSSKNEEILYFITPHNQSSIINKYDLTQKQTIDTFQVLNFKPDRVEYINTKRWNNTELIIKLNYDGNCCGCSNKQIHVMDANNHINVIFKTWQYLGDGEIDEGFSSRIDFPEDPNEENIVYREHEYGEDIDNYMEKKFHWDGTNMIEKR